jgi:hypothetical protein
MIDRGRQVAWVVPGFLALLAVASPLNVHGSDESASNTATVDRRGLRTALLLTGACVVGGVVVMENISAEAGAERTARCVMRCSVTS